MLSIVVPTMWRFGPFLDFVEQLIKVPEVGEVIIINNEVERTPIHPVLSKSKVRLLNQEKNIFVNPAWNLGVEHSVNDIVCIANDDVIVDLKLFPVLDNFIDDSIGLVGMSPGRPEFGQSPITNGEISVAPWVGQHTFGFGSFFLVHKKNWIPIPAELTVFYGDNWAFDTQIHINNKPIFVIENCFFFSPWAQTTGSVVNEWLGNEGGLYQPLLQAKIEEYAQRSR